MWYFRQRMWWVLLLIGCSMPTTWVQAEMYVAGQVGVTLPQSLSNVEVSDPSIGLPSGSTFSNLDLQNSVMYGAKLGYYFESLKWLGVETEVFNTTPHVKQQPITVTVPGSPSFTINPAGSYLRVLTWAPINLVVRYQMGKFEPYAGVGMGLFFSRLKDAGSNDSTSSTSVGLNTQVGLRYRVTNHVALFGEWKFNHARLGFDATPNAFTNADATYNAHHLVFGVGYHF
jgi:opacity protein-like surface antigen